MFARDLAKKLSEACMMRVASEDTKYSVHAARKLCNNPLFTPLYILCEMIPEEIEPPSFVHTWYYSFPLSRPGRYILHRMFFELV